MPWARRAGSRRDGVASDGGSGTGSGFGGGSGKAGGTRKQSRQGAGAAGKGTGGGDAASAVESSPMLEALRAWRRERAKRDGVPAYVVMHDKHLVAIVEAGPGSLRELGRIDGMGPRRIELYGDELLAVLGDQLPGAPTGDDSVTG